MNNHLTITRPRLTKLLCLLVAVLMLATTDAMAAKKKKGKRKGKQPVATQPAETTSEKAAETAPTPAPTPAAAPAAVETPAPAPAPAPVEATAVSTSVTTTETTTTEAVVQPAPQPSDPQPTEQAMVASAPAPDPGAPLGEPAPASDSGWKFRAGVNAGFMYFLPGPSYGMNVSARFGMKLSDMLSAYVDGGAGFGLGGGGSSTGGTVKLSLSAASFYRVGLMGELKFGPLFFAIGPALFDGVYAQMKAMGSGASAYDEMQTVEGMYPAGMARLGLSFGSRSHFTLALEGMAVLGKVTKVETSTGATSKTGDSVMALSPTLILGWDLN